MVRKSFLGRRTGELCSSMWPTANLPKELEGNGCSGAQPLPGKCWQCIPSSGMLHGSALLETSLAVSLQLSCCLGVPVEWRDSHYLVTENLDVQGMSKRILNAEPHE